MAHGTTVSGLVEQLERFPWQPQCLASVVSNDDDDDLLFIFIKRVSEYSDDFHH